MRAAKIALVVLCFTIAGCGPGVFTLGGWTRSPANQNMRAIFGGNLQAIDSNENGFVATQGPNGPAFDPGDTFRGEFEYVDPAAGVGFHATITGGYLCPNNVIWFLFPFRPVNTCSPGQAYFEGTYTPIPRTLGPGGHFEMLLTDNFEPGAGPGDRIWVFLEGGILGGFQNQPFGVAVERGAIQFHPDNSN